MVPPLSHGVSRVPQYSGYSRLFLSFAYVTVTLFRRTSHSVQLDINITLCCPNPCDISTIPRSLATTSGISVDFFSSPYLDVSVQAVPLIYLFIQYMMSGLNS